MTHDLDKDTFSHWVGPVLQGSGRSSPAIIKAICELNENVKIIDRGGYIRVLCPHRCMVTRAAIESRLGHSFIFPSDLEIVMPSFKGTFQIDEELAQWQS